MAFLGSTQHGSRLSVLGDLYDVLSDKEAQEQAQAGQDSDSIATLATRPVER